MAQNTAVFRRLIKNLVKQTCRLNPCEVLTATPSSDKSEQLSMGNKFYC